MKKFDFNSYQFDIAEYYDGFIGPNGEYFHVKVKGENGDIHNMWAEQYIKLLCKDDNCFLKLSGISDYTDLLVNVFGFIYYNHDSKYLKPVIKLPNYYIAGKKAMSNQIETLIEIMLINKEDPLHKEFIIDTQIFHYNGSDDGGCIKK